VSCLRDLKILAIFGLLAFSSSATLAESRRALVIGLGEYSAKNGVKPLTLPGNDADQMAAKLQSKGLEFTVTVYKDDKIKTKADLENAVRAFAQTVNEGDEVLVYISSHGLGVPRPGGIEIANYYLAPNAVSRKFLMEKLKTQDLDTFRSYEADSAKADAALVSQYAVSEDFLVQTINNDRKPSAFILIADACRNLIPDKTKGAGLVTGLGMPATQQRGIFRFYATSAGEFAVEADDNTAKKKPANAKNKTAPEEKPTSLFTMVLLRHIGAPRQDILSMAEKVRIYVVQLSTRLGGTAQNPDYQSALMTPGYALARGEQSEALCTNANYEVGQLRDTVALGNASNQMLREALERLSPCGKAEEITALMTLFGLGVDGKRPVLSPQTAAQKRKDAAIDKCDEKGASPLDPSRPVNVAGVEIQALAVASLANAARKRQALTLIEEAIRECEKSSNERRKVARFQFNLARSYHAMATLSEGQEALKYLELAFNANRSAVNQGYVASYNNFAIFFDDGLAVEKDPATGELIRIPGDRAKALEYFTKGADLGHVVAQYNLGLKYKDGGLGLKINKPKAYTLFAQAAEAGYVPAMIEASALLRFGYGTNSEQDPLRAVQLLETAVQRGSVTAMFHLGHLYYWSQAGFAEARSTVDRDHSKALLWFARAAEIGNVEAQVELARMLTSGQGLPAAQPQTAARYWRLAARSGNEEAQVEFATLLKNNKIEVRPDKGPEEIVELYRAAMERQYPLAATRLAELYQKGFRYRERLVIPENKGEAIAVAEKAIEFTKQAIPGDRNNEPEYKYTAASLILNIAGSDDPAIAGDEAIKAKAEKLRADLGAIEKRRYLLVDLDGCGPYKIYLPIWDWAKDEPPTDETLAWFDKRYKCTEARVGVRARCRDYLAKLHKQARTSKKSFLELVTAKNDEFWKSPRQTAHEFAPCFLEEL